MYRGRIAIAATTFACAALLSVNWSAQAQTGEGQAAPKQAASKQMTSKQVAPKHMAPKHMASKHTASRHMAAAPRGQMQRHAVRGYARGYGPNPVAAGADVAAGAVNTAGAMAAGAIGTAGAIAAAPFGGSYAAAPGWNQGNPGYNQMGYYGSSTWGDFECQPGYAGCQPYSAKNWYKR